MVLPNTTGAMNVYLIPLPMRYNQGTGGWRSGGPAAQLCILSSRGMRIIRLVIGWILRHPFWFWPLCSVKKPLIFLLFPPVVSSCAERTELLGSVLFSLSLNFKQMALYYAPAIFFFLLASCVSESSAGREVVGEN